MLREKWRIITAALLVTGAVFCPLTYADDSGDDFEIVSTQKSAGQQNNDPGFDISTDDSSDENVSFEIVAKKQTKELDLSQRIITDDPEFEIVRTRAPKKLQNGTTAEKKEHVDPAISEYEKKKKIYDDYVKEKKTPRDFLFFSYIPFDNTINGIDARLFITGVLVSLFYVVFMLVVLTREIGRRPRLYSAEQMIALRNQGYGQIPEDQANQMANDLWNRVSGGKAVDDYNEQTGDYLLDAGSHGEVNAVYSELEVTASALPTSEEAIAQLNRLSDSVCFWRTRALVAPWINVDSGWIKRIIMLLVYLALVFYVYPGHPMFLLVIFCPLAFWTPAYLIDARENSKVYRMLGGSLKIFGKITGSALNTVATAEGSTVTVYTDGFGNVKRVEHNFWGTFIIFALKITVAFLFLYLVFTLAPLIVLYALIRNYVVYK